MSLWMTLCTEDLKHSPPETETVYGVLAGAEVGSQIGRWGSKVAAMTPRVVVIFLSFGHLDIGGYLSFFSTAL